MSRRTNTLLAASAFAVLLAAGPVAASAAHPEGQAANAAEQEGAGMQEGGLGPAGLQALSGAKVSLQQAIATAQQKTGGSAFDAAVAENNGHLLYSIATVANGGGVTHVLVDPVTGVVLSSPGLAVVNPGQQQDAALTAAAKISLAAAIQAASAKAQGPVIVAGLHNENGQAVYQVEIAAPGHVQQFNVDPTTGAVTASLQKPDQGEQEGFASQEKQGGHGGHEGPGIESND